MQNPGRFRMLVEADVAEFVDREEVVAAVASDDA